MIKIRQKPKEVPREKFEKMLASKGYTIASFARRVGENKSYLYVIVEGGVTISEEKWEEWMKTLKES